MVNLLSVVQMVDTTRFHIILEQTHNVDVIQKARSYNAIQSQDEMVVHETYRGCNIRQVQVDDICRL